MTPSAVTPLRLSSDLPFLELETLATDAALRAAVEVCITSMKRAAADRLAHAERHPDAEREVTPEALNALLQRGVDVHGIAEDRHISNVIVFNDRRYPDGVFDEAAADARRRVDELMRRCISRIFETSEPLECAGSGFLLYPPGSYMGWHTNAKKPGWRLMLTWADEPDRSFFRYRDPDDGRIVTATDRGFNVRVLNIRAAPPLWHAVYADVCRYTLGYVVYPRVSTSLPARIVRRLRRMLA